MILQGSDALSRGVWITPFQDTMDQRKLTAAVFAPLTPDDSLVRHYITTFGLPSVYFLQDWDSEWLATRFLDNFTVWFPPPELARQAIVFTLSAWVQRPRTSSALFFVPRVVPGFWFGLSRHIKELPYFQPRDFPLTSQPVLPIPVIVLYIAPHVPAIPSKHSRLDRTPAALGARWHRQQAEHLRGLPSIPLSVETHPEMSLLPSEL